MIKNHKILSGSYITASTLREREREREREKQKLVVAIIGKDKIFCPNLFWRNLL